MLKRTAPLGLLLLLVITLFSPQQAAAADGLEWRGLITGRPSPGNLGTWEVGGTSFEANAGTEINEEEGPLTVDACAKVRYFVSGADKIALEIDSEPANDCDNGGGADELKLYAPIEVIPANLNDGIWTIGGINFESTADTELEQEHGAFAVGRCAEVEYTQSSGDPIATKIGTEDAYQCSGGTATNEAYGLIDSFPANLSGEWVINAIPYNATNTTEFQQEDGTFAVGACVKVTYFVEGGLNQAIEIETEGGDDCGQNGTPTLPTEAKLYATIDSFPASPFTGPWQIGGLAFEAAATTEFEQDDGVFGVGVCVKADYRQDGGTRRLREVDTEEAYKCQDDTNAPLFKAYGVVEAFPASPFVGSWQVSGISYTTDNTTSFEQPNGFFAVGAFVEVKFTDPNTVVSIETHVGPKSGRQTVLGELENHDANDDWQDWVIDGQTYKADPAIEVGTNGQPITVGNPVLLNVYRGSDGVNYITSVERPFGRFLPIVTGS